MFRSCNGLPGALLFVICTLLAGRVHANHLFGADFNYTWVSGNTYNIRLIVYGDCAGAFTSGSTFNTLSTASPVVYIYKNNALIDSISLILQGPGVEVTPVCPSQANQTTCSVPGSTIQGVKRFIYSRNYTLNGPSPNWLFQFNGGLPASANALVVAGRSTAINNINSSPGSIMRLEATLNNSGGNNSSPVYTTIPTPFFCINKPASYNPGTVDPNTDGLSFALVDGLEALPPNGVGGTVPYTGTYTGAAPLSAVTGTFAFNNTNGQLDFTPNLTNNFLVVSKVTETRSGVVVGTSMREMVFVIVPCNNNPPGGSVSSLSTGATIVNGTTINICKKTGLFNFKINPADIDGDIINVAATGLPAGATFNVANNNTTAPQSTFTWNVNTAAIGTYTFFVTFTDQGCPLASKQTIAYTINVLPNPVVTFALVSPATCLKKAIFTLTPAANSNPNTITFGSVTRTGVNGTITDSLSPGTYTVTITGSNGCSHDTSISIASPSNINLAAAVKQSICSTLGNGRVTLNASSGASPYTYALGTGAFSSANTFSPLVAGSYTFRVKDNVGCTKDTSIAITDSLIISGLATTTNVQCFNGNTGAVTIAGQGGTNPYNYAIGTGTYGINAAFGGLTAGSYVIHIKDNNGCIKDTTIAIAQPTVLGVTGTVTNATCNGGATGSITLTGSGGTPAYTYALGAGAYSASNVFSGLTAGSYILHIQDANGCIKDISLAVAQPPVLSFTATVTNVLCNGGSTGAVTVNATGGTPAYTYAADAGAFGASNVLTGLNAGAHIIHLKDANGCTRDSSITITQPALLGITVTNITQPACNGGGSGSITITGTGGTTPYTYAIGTGAFGTSGTFGSLAAGTYVLHVKDANGCLKDTTVTMGQPIAILVSAAIKRPRCTPLVNGEVTLTASGGVPGYTYAAGAGAYGASPAFANLGSGTYVFRVKDTRNCIKDTIITVTDSLFVRATLAITPAKCFGEANGSIAITPGGGDLPYTFALGAGAYSTANPINNLAAGPYVLHVRDNNGCRLDTNIAVGQPTIIVPAVTVTQPKCFGESTGQLVAGAGGGTPVYTFALDAGTYGTSGTFTGLDTGIYTIHIKDNNGCMRDTTIIMGQPTRLVINSMTVSHLFCFGDSSGFVIVNASGATPPYTYASDVRAFVAANRINGLSAGPHVIRVQDANSCLKDTALTLFEPPKVNVLITSVINPTCEGYKDGTVKIAATSGTPGTNPAYTYSNDNITFGSQQTYSSLGEGSYIFYAKDGNGCVRDTAITLKGYPHIVINGATITSPSCYGFKDGSFTLNVTGGNQPLTYVLISPRDTNVTGAFDSLVKGTYAIRITDTTKCLKDTVVRIDQPDSVVATTVVTPNDCVGVDNGGGVKAVVTGGTAPYTYLWSTTPVQTADNITGMPNGPYVVYVTDAKNCRDTASALVAYDNCCKPFIPDAFTPNADGRNDKFHVLWKGDIQLLNFSVYNRYGQRIFYTTSTEAGWDGTWNSQPQDLGTYFYYIKMICGNGGDNVLEYKGDVTLIR